MEKMAFPISWKKAESGIAPILFFIFFVLQDSTDPVKQSFLMKKVNIYRKKWHYATSWIKRNRAFLKFFCLSLSLELVRRNPL